LAAASSSGQKPAFSMEGNICSQQINGDNNHDNRTICIVINVNASVSGDAVRIGSKGRISAKPLPLAAAISNSISGLDPDTVAAFKQAFDDAFKAHESQSINEASVEALNKQSRELLAKPEVFTTVVPRLEELAHVQSKADAALDPEKKKEAQQALDVGDLERAKRALATGTAFAAVGASVAMAGGLTMYTGIGLLIYAGARAGGAHDAVAPGWTATLGGLGALLAAGVPALLYVSSHSECADCKTAGTLSAALGYGGIGVGAVTLLVGLGFGAFAIGDKIVLALSCSNGVCPASRADTVSYLHLNATRSDDWLLAGSFIGAAGVVLLVPGYVLNHDPFGPSSATPNSPTRASELQQLKVDLFVDPPFAGVKGTFQ
jgi:hypothetical protein